MGLSAFLVATLGVSLSASQRMSVGSGDLTKLEKD
jgi:hypothetical protein